MKLFIYKLFYFLAPIVLIGFIIELALRKIPNDYAFKKDFLDKNSNKINTLILGSSHAYYGIDPNYFTNSTFNASHISQSLDYDFEILKKYECCFNNLKTIIIPISYFSLFTNLESGIESWRKKNYVIYYHFKVGNSLKDFSEILSNRLNVNIKRISSYYIRNINEITCSTLGWGLSYDSANNENLLETGVIAARRHTLNIGSKNAVQSFQNNCKILDAILEFTNKKNIRIIFLTLPAYESYRNNLDTVQLNRTTRIIKELVLKNSNCKYFNLLFDTCFVAHDYYDADHLSRMGAKKLSTILNNINN